MDRRATFLVLLFGLVSLFGDITYEGARSIFGPYIGSLGGGIALAGIAGGLGELISYSLRALTGYLADKLRSHWLFTFLGYAIGLFSVPLMGFCSSAHCAFVLAQTERLGKAIRNPSRDYLIGSLSAKYGRSFAIHEAVDQIGAILGPVIMAFAVFSKGYSTALKLMFVPAIISMALLMVTRKLYPSEDATGARASGSVAAGLSRKDRWRMRAYMLFAFLTTLGFVNFQIVSFHFKMWGLSDFQIPMVYALAMFVDSVTAVPFGLLFDRRPTLALAFVPIFGFLGSLSLLNPVFILFWGAYMGLSESILKSGLAKISRDATAFGALHMFSGISALLSSVVFSRMYDVGIHAMVIFSLATQLVAFILLVKKIGVFWEPR